MVIRLRKRKEGKTSLAKSKSVKLNKTSNFILLHTLNALMKTFYLLFLLFISPMILPAQVLLQHEKICTFSTDTFEQLAKKMKVPKAFRAFTYDVDVYEITYRGYWTDGSPLKARGLCFIPAGMNEEMAETIYGHGTRIEQACSVSLKNGQMVTAAIMASDGYFSLYPYYYGMGGGDSVHLYIHSQTESGAMAYMILAGRELQQKLGLKNNGQVFLSGYSQGGHVAMATHQFLEAHPELGIRVAASSPMSGPYDLTGVQSEVMFKPYDRPHYLPYLLVSYQLAYQLIPGDITEVFQPQYQCEIEDFFKLPRKKGHSILDKKLPPIPRDMIEPHFLDAYQNDSAFPFRRHLEQNSNWKWVPRAPMQLCACYGDNEVSYKNSLKAAEYMQSQSAPVHLRLFGKSLNHQRCAPFAFMYTKIFFDRIRAGKANPEKVPAGKQFLLRTGIRIAEAAAKRKK